MHLSESHVAPIGRAISTPALFSGERLANVKP
jgi:hypothetical protein